MQQAGSQVAAGAQTNWLVFPRRTPAAPLRLFCFPSAGHGPAMFRAWLPLLPPTMELSIAHLPGRESRWNEPALVRIDDVADALAAALRSQLDRPFVFFGHSLGALIAFEVARRLLAASGAAPQHFFASAHRAPQRPNRHPRIAQLDDAAFVQQVNARHGGIPDAVAANRELMELMLPSLRADYRVFEDYTYTGDLPLPCPLTAFAGTQDTHVTLADVEPWREQTSGPFTLQQFEGGHFFVNEQRPQVVSALLQALQVSRV